MQIEYPVNMPALISQYFGDRPSAYPATGGHMGIDYAVGVGTPVLAASGGKVVAAGWDTTGYGSHVRVQHAEGVTIYGHLSAIHVSVGQVVHAGEALGLSGNTGNSTGPHLHFEVRLGDGSSIKQAVDPMPLFSMSEHHDIISSLPTTFPAPAVRVNVAALTVRRGPTIRERSVGMASYGDELVCLGVVEKSDREVWLCVGHKQYVAAVYDDFQMVTLITKSSSV